MTLITKNDNGNDGVNGCLQNYHRVGRCQIDRKRENAIFFHKIPSNSSHFPPLLMMMMMMTRMVMMTSGHSSGGTDAAGF